MHVAHIPQCIAQILNRQPSLGAVKDHRCLTHLLQRAVDPFRTVTARESVGAKGDLKEREPLGVGFLTNIRLKRRDIEVLYI